MSKSRVVSQTIKYMARLLAYGLKLTVSLAVHLLLKAFKVINERLRFSITFKTVSIYTATFSVILFALSIAVVSSFGVFYTFQTKTTLDKDARVAAEMLRGGTGIPADSLKKYADIEGITITLFNQQKGISYTTADKKDGIKFNDNTADLSEIISSGNHTISVNTQLAFSNNVYYLQLSKSLLGGIPYLAVLVTGTIVCFSFAIIFTVAIGYRTGKRMLKPVDDMIRTARSISARELDTRLNVVDSHDELKDLAVTFNELLDRIQASYEQQNRFVSDASHELRTPISVIQGYANLLQRWGKEEKAVLEESVCAIKNEADNMKDLVEKLLFLARADKHTQSLEKSSFAMNELVDEVIRETRLIDSEHNITCDINETITINADRGLIKQALRIFVDNSIKYTLRGGTIKINSEIRTNRIFLTIQDNGIGISREDIPHIFERFFKCDKSRTREGGGSSGLGLSISQWIVEKHQGTISVESELNKGTKITITFPVSNT